MRILWVLALLGLGLAPGAAPAGDAGDLTAAVAAQLPATAEHTGSRVTVLRQRPGGWAFGTAVRLAPDAPGAYPDGWLWLARAEPDRPGRWRVALARSPRPAGRSQRARCWAGSAPTCPAAAAPPGRTCTSRCAATAGTWTSTGTRSASGRSGPGTSRTRAPPGTAPPGSGWAVGTVPDGATVRVVCSARGTTHTGRGGYTSDMWNRLAGDRGWVSDVYLWTGTGAPVAGWCPEPD